MNNLEFLTAEHYDVFKQLTQRLTNPGDVKKEYFSALYVIAGNERLRNTLLPYMDFENGKISTATIIDDNTFVKQDLILVKLVIHLYNNKEWVLPSELITLSEQDYQLAMQAITLCRDQQFDDVVIPTDQET